MAIFLSHFSSHSCSNCQTADGTAVTVVTTSPPHDSEASRHPPSQIWHRCVYERRPRSRKRNRACKGYDGCEFTGAAASVCHLCLHRMRQRLETEGKSTVQQILQILNECNRFWGIKSKMKRWI